MALPKQNRLRSSRDFSRVYRKGKKAATKHLVLRALKITALKITAKPEDREAEGSAIKSRQRLLTAERHKDERSVDEGSSALSSCFGVSISKKVSKRAVVRNRIKRQIKAILREKIPDIRPGWQIVIVVRPSAVECDFADFLRELNDLLKKLKLLAPKD